MGPRLRGDDGIQLGLTRRTTYLPALPLLQKRALSFRFGVRLYRKAARTSGSSPKACFPDALQPRLHLAGDGGGAGHRWHPGRHRRAVRRFGTHQGARGVAPARPQDHAKAHRRLLWRQGRVSALAESARQRGLFARASRRSRQCKQARMANRDGQGGRYFRHSLAFP